MELLLTHRYRRYLLYCLYFHATPMTLPDVADQLTVWDTDADDDDLLQERLWIYDSLYFEHLPELCDADVVVYSQREDMVELGPAADRLEPRVRREFARDGATLLDAERTTFES